MGGNLAWDMLSARRRMATMTDWDLHNDDYKITYRWEYNLDDFPESIKIHEYVNDQLREIMDVKEGIVRKAAVAILRAKGYTVIEPRNDADRTP